ncbi:MAG: hypothetical protein AB7P76_06090 [Candidatus Melainabacteria bacterium]
MKNMNRRQSLASLSMACLIALSAAGLNAGAEEVPAVLTTPAGLKGMTHFSVAFSHDPYEITSPVEESEIIQQLRETMTGHAVLPYGEPGDGVVRLSCEGYACRRVKVEVTAGEQGPVVWQDTVKRYHGNVPLDDLIRKPKSLAHEIMDRLTEAKLSENGDSGLHTVNDTP